MNGKEIRKKRKILGITQTELAKMLGVTRGTIVNYENDKQIPESKRTILYNILNEVNSPEELEIKETQHVDSVPYYDVDFTASFLEIENTQKTKPDYYVTHPFFKGCDYIVRASGQSMAKVIKHGDAIGLVKIDNWIEFIPMGEIYAIVTKNGFRMIKIITKGESNESYTLISKPSENKKDEFPPQQINKSQILSIFKVQASSHLF